MYDDIASVELIVRKMDGTAFALNLDRQHVRITIDVDLPPVDDGEITELAKKYVTPLLYNRMIMSVRATRRPEGSHLLAFRLLEPGTEERA